MEPVHANKEGKIWDAGSIELCGESYLSINQLREFVLLSGTLRVEHSGESIDPAPGRLRRRMHFCVYMYICTTPIGLLRRPFVLIDKTYNAIY